MIRRYSAVLAVALVVLAAGCSTNTDLSGVRVPNSRPDTRITGQPPTLLEAGFAIDLNWTGSDADGRIVGYEWKISNNGKDGISPRDTLTVDPLTGAVLNPWQFTAANDTTFLVLADQPEFPGDEYSNPRSYRTHSVFIRSVDDKGEVDPSPAYISFTSTTVVPTCRVVYPNLSSQSSSRVPPSVNIGWIGTDTDFDLGVPTQVRFLWKSAQYDTTDLGEPRYIRTPFEYNLHRGEVLDFEDPEWSDWRGYDALDADRRVQFPDQPVGDYFLFAVQVRDTAGAVSIGMDYAKEVANVRINSGFFPAVTLSEPFLGTPTSSETFNEIAGGQPLNFSWTATADAYFGEIVSYRHGWDLIDVNDANDPGWAVPPGLSKQNLFAATRSFQDGLHTFILRVEDDSKQVRIITWRLEVIPFVARDKQLPLLVIDQVVDPANLTNNWLDASGRPRNSEVFRNAYWHFLAEGSGGVSGISWDRDWKDHTDGVAFADVVKYKSVLCYAQYHDILQLMFRQFRPEGGQDKFVWLAPYQEKGGNFFLAGGGSMESFLEGVSNYMVPIIFDSRQTTYPLDGVSYVIGFGNIELPDGTRVQRGPGMYPYATSGIAGLDWTSPGTKTIYGQNRVARFDRKSDCVGLKGLVLDANFKTNHSIGPGVIPDTMFTNPEIDWHDPADARGDTLSLKNDGYNYPFRNDEFYDANISVRSDPILLQECDIPEAPGGLCIEPMFTGISRFDWLREIEHSQGDTEWPQSELSNYDLDDACGPLGLTSFQGRDRSSAPTNGQTYGFVSYKMYEDKPWGAGDVYWGFDPYRFDEDGSRKAIRWVLDYFGLPINP